MQLVVNRFVSDKDSTLSSVTLDGVAECWGVEDEYRPDKVPGETRIPAGTYSVRLRTEGGFHNTYTRKFPGFHRGMLEIADVPNFEYVLIHIGNDESNTSGCLCVGTFPVIVGRMAVTSSTAAYKKLYSRVIDAAEAWELTITFVDSDRAVGATGG